MSRDPLPKRTVAALRLCHLGAAILAGIALAATVHGRLDLAIVSLAVALLAVIFASDAMRVILLYIRELRR